MEKQAIRESVWDRLTETGVGRFPYPLEGRIPNFAGAKRAAEHLFDLSAWESAKTIKANPDYAQYPVRVEALATDRELFMATPRLAEERPFRHLAPETIDDPGEAGTIGGATEYGTPTDPDAMPPIDLIVVGSVAVTRAGVRIGKGEGYSDLEYAILTEFDRVTENTPVVTTVHEQQVLDVDIDPERHDVPVDWIVTPERAIRVEDAAPPPRGIEWDLLDAADRQDMPVLTTLADRSA